MLDVALVKRQGAFTVDVAFVTDGPGVTALFGRSGAGKTSVVSMVAGLTRPDGGRIVVDGRVLFDSERGVDVAPEKRRIGYVFQEGRLFPHLSVRANLTYGMALVAPGERTIGFDQVVSLLGIEHLLGRRPGRLSGGEKQRVAIGRALLTSPRLLLMDEPLAALDHARKSELLPFIARLTHELSLPILYVSHAADEILTLANALVLLEEGRSVAVGTVEEVMSRLDLRPLTGRFEAGSVIPTVVESHDEAFGMTHLRFAGGVIKVIGTDLPLGAAVRVRVHARDVALALEPPRRISMQNMFEGTITEIAEAEGAVQDLRLDVGGCSLWARVTAQSRHDLGLERGVRVYALVKSVSFVRGDLGVSAPGP